MNLISEIGSYMSKIDYKRRYNLDSASNAPTSPFIREIQQRISEIDRLPASERGQANERITQIANDLLDQGNPMTAFETTKKIKGVKANTPSPSQIKIQCAIVDRLREEGKLLEAVNIAKKIPNFARLGDTKVALIWKLKKADMQNAALEVFNLFPALNILRTRNDPGLNKIFHAMDQVDRERLDGSEEVADEKYEEIAQELLSQGHLQAARDITYKMIFTNYKYNVLRELVDKLIKEGNFQEAKDVALTIPFVLHGAIEYYTEFIHILRQNGAEEEANEVKAYLTEINTRFQETPDEHKPDKLL